jgi:hypothetical protein
MQVRRAPEARPVQIDDDVEDVTDLVRTARARFR